MPIRTRPTLRPLLALTSALLLAPAAQAASPMVFYSPTDDGSNPGRGCPLDTSCVLGGTNPPDPIHLYVDPGDEGGSGEGPCQEVCGIDTFIEVEGSVFTEFLAEPGVSHTPDCDFGEGGEEEGGCPLPPLTTRIHLVASFASAPAPEGPRRLGTLFVDTPGPPPVPVGQGTAVSMNGISMINADLDTRPLETRFIAVPEPAEGLALGAGLAGLLALRRLRRRAA